MSEHENPDKTVKILNTSRIEKISLTNKNQYKKINENNSEPIEEITDKQSRINKRNKEEFHFQTKLRNLGKEKGLPLCFNCKVTILQSRNLS